MFSFTSIYCCISFQALLHPYFFTEPLPAHHSELPIPARNARKTSGRGPLRHTFDIDVPLEKSLVNPASLVHNVVGMPDFHTWGLFNFVLRKIDFWNSFQLKVENNTELLWFCFSSSCDWSRAVFSISLATRFKTKTLFPALKAVCLSHLLFLVNSHWLAVLFCSSLIGYCNHFGCDWTTVNRNDMGMHAWSLMGHMINFPYYSCTCCWKFFYSRFSFS